MIKYILILIALPCNVIAQISIHATAGYGTFKMAEQKKFQQELKSLFPEDSGTPHEFPAYSYFEASATTPPVLGRFYAGVSFTYASTGGRVYYSDYSGFLRADQLVQSFSIGIPAGFFLTDPEKSFTIQLELRPMGSYSNLDIEFEQVVATQQEEESLGFTSTNLSLQPCIIFGKRFKMIGVHIQAGYHQTVLKGKLFFKENDDAFLLDQNDKPVYTDWSGFRLGAGMSLILGQ